jgi:hypothetical protein
MKTPLRLLIGLFAIAVGGSALAQQPAQTSGQSSPPPSAAPQETRPKRVHADLSGFELPPKPAAGNSSVQVGGGSRGESHGPFLYAPRRGKSYITTPTFYWGPNDAPNDFKLTVFDSDRRVVYETTVHGTSFTYPASASALKPGGTYSWTVQLGGTIHAEPVKPVEFVLLSSEERNAMDQTLKGIVGDSLDEQLKRAEVFVNARLWYDSVAAYSALIDKYPGHAELYNRRGEIYDQIRATRGLADSDFRNAEELLKHPQQK